MVVEQLTWQQFDEAVDRVANAITGKVQGVFGVSRGGLPMAVALSHRLKVPLVKRAGADVLWVDDIVDSGYTLENAKKLFGYYACWITRAPIDELIHADIITNAWVIFPWEDANSALQDYDDYMEKMRNVKN
jgi:hypoxanthine phosphoribosyltransferase